MLIIFFPFLPNVRSKVLDYSYRLILLTMLIHHKFFLFVCFFNVGRSLQGEQLLVWGRELLNCPLSKLYSVLLFKGHDGIIKEVNNPA